ncbi:MAG: hypothetical protein ABI678_18080 [Kofleriaceae bacterium]
MAGPDDDDKPKGGAWPPDAEYAVPTGSPDVYDPNYIPPPADPAHDEGGAAEGPPAALYPGGEPTGSQPGSVAAPADEPLLPPELGADGALQAAVGAPSARARKRAQTQPRGDDDDLDADPLAPKRSKRTMVIASLSIVAGLGIATLVFLGRANAQHYAITCDASRAKAVQGRSFPPWGTRALNGAEWAPIALPPNAECQPRETDDQGELAKWYLAILVDRATVTLTAKDLLDRAAAAASGAAATNPLDAVSVQLEQALLLARDPDRRDERKEVTRLQGDVEYWRAAARLRDASAVLLDAAKQFEAANQQHPRRATDAAAWSTFLHHLADELQAGPNGAPPVGPVGIPASATPTGGPPVPVGTALPVEPDDNGGSAAAPATPDAGVPSGGVLL